MRANKGLTRLDFRLHGIADNDYKLLSDALCVNNTLKCISFKDGGISEGCVAELVETLHTKGAATLVYLGWRRVHVNEHGRAVLPDTPDI